MILDAGHTQIIAEVGPNHDGSVTEALRFVEAIAETGVDAVKFQTFVSADSVVASGARLAGYMKARSAAKDQVELLEQVRLSFDDFVTIANACSEAGLTFLSTPFDEPSVRFLDELGVPLLKVPSGELTNLFLLEAVAATGLPLIVSTGMSDLAEVRAGLDVVRGVWSSQGHTGDAEPDIVLLHCTSAYPAPPDDANLLAMRTLEREFSLPVGYSDHTLGLLAPITAAALGARVIEKHVTFDPARPGPDHAASLPIARLTELVESVRQVEAMLGDSEKVATQVEEDVRRVARRSVAARRPIAAGESFVRDDLTALRPASGISPMRVADLLGRRASRQYATGELIDVEETRG